MKSPFPGMDPYLEARWSDVHASLLFAIKEALQPELPSGLRARTEERVVLEDAGGGEPISRYRPDVAVVDTGRGHPSAGGAAAAVAVPEPFTVRFFDEPQVDRFLQIVDVTNGNRVITAIEVLSPWNKNPGRVNEEYRRKLKDYAASGVNVVEIDLLRSPRGRLTVTENDMPVDRRAPWYVAVRPAAAPEERKVYPIALRAPIPPFDVPLRETDVPIALRLQPLIERVYIAGGHDDIDYSKAPIPPLSSQDETWMDQLLRAAGRR
jgi:hypothetical protein